MSRKALILVMASMTLILFQSRNRALSRVVAFGSRNYLSLKRTCAVFDDAADQFLFLACNHGSKSPLGD